jgi:hypothetical protein
MRSLVARIRPRLSYATVVSSLTAFVVLCGGAAFAANQLGKNSVGKKHLKANAVTTKKIKKDAVTGAKIRGGAVDGTKVLDGSIGAANLNLADMPFSRIVHEARGPAGFALSPTPSRYPLDPPTYTQAADEDDFYFGTLEVTFSPGCGEERRARAELLIDPVNPSDPSASEIVAFAEASDEAAGTVTETMRIVPGEGGGIRFQPGTPTNRTLFLMVSATCKSGSGVTVSNGAVDVIGIR